MVVLYIVLGILLLLSILLMCPIVIDLSFNEKFILKLKYLFFKFSLPTKSAKKEKPKKGKKNSGNKVAVKQMIKRDGILETCKFFADVLKLISKELIYLLKRSVVSKLKLDISVCGEDAAVTAIEYGSVCALVYPIVGFLSAFMDFKKEMINIESDFDGNGSNIQLNMVVKTKMFFLVVAAISLIYKILTDNNYRNISNLRMGN